MVDVLPLFTIFVVVVGSIFARIAAPEEAAALGCIAAIIISAIYGQLNRANLMKALRETAKVNGMLLFIIAGSLTFAQVLQVSGATSGVLQAISGIEFDRVTAMLTMMLILLFLGCFMDQISMILLTLPFFIPISLTLGIHPTWLMVMMLIAMEISLLTPPFGLLLFVMRGVAPKHIGLGKIYMAAVPFVLIELAVMVFLALFPAAALWLPSMLK